MKQKYPALVLPDSVVRTQIAIWSNGIRLDGDLFRPKEYEPDTKLPGIVLSHGWGGGKHTGERYAAKFAHAGMIAVTFTHNSWHGSGSNVVVLDDKPEPDENNEATIRVRFVREVIDPLQWIQNFRAATDYLEGEPGVDVSRIGAWGTSFGGGTATSCAIHDDRIQVLVIQVPALRELEEPVLSHAKQRAIDMARGVIDPFAEGLDPRPELAGTLNLAKTLQYDVAQQVDKLKVPTLILDAENEALFDNTKHAGRVYDALSSNGVTAHYETIKGIDHYGMYFDGFEQGSAMAVDWFKRHL